MNGPRHRPGRLSRRDFLKVGGAGLAGAALMGTAGCGGVGQQGGGASQLVFTSAPDHTETTQKLVQKFNDQNRGKYNVVFREATRTRGSASIRSGPRCKPGAETWT